MKEFIYIGFSLPMLERMLQSRMMKCIGVVTRKSRVSDEMIRLCVDSGLSVYYVEDKAELAATIKKLGDNLYVMNHFNIIIPEEIASRYTIINIHGGDLKTNRGKNPFSWSILDGDSFATISIHKISGEIDKGLLLGKVDIPITETDDYLSLGNKFIDSWSKIEEVILSYCQGGISGELIKEGVYRRGILESDFTIDMEQDTEEIVVRKIKSQKGFRGAVIRLKNLKLYVTDWDRNAKHKKI